MHVSIQHTAPHTERKRMSAGMGQKSAHTKQRVKCYGVSCLPASKRTNGTERASEPKESSMTTTIYSGWNGKWERGNDRKGIAANRENRGKNFLTNTKYTRQTEHTYSIQCAAHELMAARVSCRKAAAAAAHFVHTVKMNEEKKWRVWASVVSEAGVRNKKGQ